MLHAKAATIDGRRLLVGSFNLDPFSLVNLEALVEVTDPGVAEQGETWIQDHFARSPTVTSVDASSRLRRWLLDPFGLFVARLATVLSRRIARRSRGPTRRTGVSPA
jgi:cardiolipin synthase